MCLYTYANFLKSKNNTQGQHQKASIFYACAVWGGAYESDMSKLENSSGWYETDHWSYCKV